MEKIMIKLKLRGKIFIVDRDVLMSVTGTYFYGLLSSGVWQPNSDGIYVIDRHNEGFERILDCLRTGKLNCLGLTEYEIECVIDNLDYFLVPYIRVWDYSKVTHKDGISLKVHLQLSDGRLCGAATNNTICISDFKSNLVETTLGGDFSHNVTAIIQLEDGRICSCSQDAKIKLWNIESGQCDRTIVGHTNSVNGVIQLMDGRLCSVSWDNTIKYGASIMEKWS